jgi:hypothetical protein
MSVNLPTGSVLKDLLEPQNTAVVHQNEIIIQDIPPFGARILLVKIK